MTTPRARKDRLVLMWAVRAVFLAAATTSIFLIVHCPPADSRERMLFIGATMLATASAGMQVLVAVLGDRLRTLSDTYLIGYAHGRADVDDEIEQRRRSLRLVQ